MANRETLHRLLDNIPDEHLDAAEYALGALQPDPLARMLYLAPYDDEPYTDEERAEVERIVAEGRWVPHEEVVRMLDQICAEQSGVPEHSTPS